MTPLRIICSDAQGWPVHPRCRIYQMNARLEEINAMFDRGCPHEQIAYYITSGGELDVEVTVESLRNHDVRLDAIRRSQGDSSDIFPS